MNKYIKLLSKIQSMLDTAQLKNKYVDKYNLAALIEIENDLYKFLTDIGYHGKYGQTDFKLSTIEQINKNIKNL